MGPNASEGAVAAPSNPNVALVPGVGELPPIPPLPQAQVIPGAQIPGYPPETQASAPAPPSYSQTPVETPAYVGQYTEAPPPIAANTQPIPTNQPPAETFASMTTPLQPDLRGLPSSNPLAGPQLPPNPAEAPPQNPMGQPVTLGQENVTATPPTETFAQMAPNVVTGEAPRPEKPIIKLAALKAPIRDILRKEATLQAAMLKANDAITTGGPNGGHLDPEEADVWAAAAEEDMAERLSSNPK